MEKRNNKYISLREGELDYASTLESYANTGNNIYDSFVINIANGLREIYDVDPFSKQPLFDFKRKINNFMKINAGLSYDLYSKNSNPEVFDSDDYKTVHPKIKKHLFDYRSKLYIYALANSIEQGLDLEETLNVIKDSIIPFIKKEIEEPTYNSLLEVLIKKEK